MPHRRQPWYVTGLHFCGSCLVTLACWAAWLALSASLACLLYIALAQELPVPDFVLRRIEADLARANLAITFGRAHLDPTGKILFEDVQLRVRQFEDPLVTSRLVYLRRNIWSVLSGRPVPDEIRLEGAALQLPAMLSPTGTVEPLIRDLAVVLRHDGNRWSVDQFAGRIGQVTVTAAGELLVPARPAGAAPLLPAELARRFLQFSRQVALEVHQLDAFDQPVLAVRLDSPAGVGNTASVLFTAVAAHQPWGRPLTLGPLALAATLRLDGAGPRPVRVHAAVRRANYEGRIAVENVRAVLAAEFRPDNFSARPLEIHAVAGALTAEGETVLGPAVRADLARWPAVHTTAATQLRGEFIAAEVEAELGQQSARILAEGRVSPALIGSVLRQHTPRAASYFVFGDPVTFRADATLAPGWKFTGLTSRVDAGRLDSHGVLITAARGQIDIQGLSFLAHDARVELGDYYARGSYWMDFGTTDYRMLLDGRVKPVAIDGWFIGNWWRNFWEDNFGFPGAPPVADVEVAGRWKEPARTVYFGRADTVAVNLHGADFEQAHTLIFLRPHFTQALELSASRAGGAQRLAGTFTRFAEADSRETRRLDFDFDSSLDLATYGRMTDGKLDALLGSLKFSRPPQVHAQGAIAGPPPELVPAYTFTGSAAGGLQYFGFPLDTVRVAGAVAGPDVRLDAIDFSAAGGTGKGKASLTGPESDRRLGLEVRLNGADLARIIRSLEQFEAGRTGAKPSPSPESNFMKRAAGGRLDVAFAAEGVPGNLPSFKGAGTAALTGTELGEINLFGVLSQVLSGLSLNFSSLKLDSARTSFRMADGRLYFPDLKITGPSAVIDARGDYTFAGSALDFTAKLKPFQENRNPLTFAIGIVVNPITSILELKLTGPLSKPDWSIVVGPSAPPPAAPPAGSPPSPPGAVPPADAVSAPKNPVGSK